MIGDVKIDHENLLTLEDFNRIYMCIKKHVEPRLKSSLDHLKKHRRRALANIDLEKYRAIVLEMSEIEGEIYDKV